MRNKTHHHSLLVVLIATVLVCGLTNAAGRNISREPSDRTETLCHIPPGNPDNAQTIVVSQWAVAAHLAHGDTMGECPEERVGPPAPVAKTGQTDCYHFFVEGDLPPYYSPGSCEGTGQDGEYQAGVLVNPRFTDNLDGTVTDNLTGLIWLKQAQCLHGDWEEGLSLVSQLADGSCGLTDGSMEGEWRMPNVRELLSLIDFSRYRPAFPIPHPFDLEGTNQLWSSTTFSEGDPTTGANQWFYAYALSLIDGAVGPALKSWSSRYIWPVRGGQLNNTPSECGDGEITGTEMCEIDADCAGVGDWPRCEGCQCRWCGDGILTYPEACDGGGELECGLGSFCWGCLCTPTDPGGD